VELRQPLWEVLQVAWNINDDLFHFVLKLNCITSLFAGAAVIGSLFGVAGAGLSGFKMQKRVGEVEEFQIKPLRKALSSK